MRADYVVGADGYHSLVRAAAGIALTAGTYALSFVLGDVQMDWPMAAEATQLFLSEGEFLLVAPFPQGRHRLIATLDAAPEEPSPEALQAILYERGPRPGTARIHALSWSSRFRIYHGVAAAFRAVRRKAPRWMATRPVAAHVPGIRERLAMQLVELGD